MSSAVSPVAFALLTFLAGAAPVFQSQTPAPSPRPRPAPASTVPAGGVDVPIVAFVPSPIVEVLVNGQGPFRFLLDTAASGHARADVTLVKKLGLPVVGQAQGADGTGRGVRTTMDIVRIESVKIGGAEFRGVDAASRDYNTGQSSEPIDGILGIGMFADHLLTIDFPKQRLRIAPGALPAADDRTIVPASFARGVPTIKIRVADTVIDADVDSGSRGAVTLPLSLAPTLPLAAAPVEAGRARTVSNTLVLYEAALKGSVFLGQNELPNPTLQFAEQFRIGNVGAQVLRKFVVTFDQRQGLVRLEPK
jgi:hypothetical protein